MGGGAIQYPFLARGAEAGNFVEFGHCRVAGAVVDKPRGGLGVHSVEGPEVTCVLKSDLPQVVHDVVDEILRLEVAETIVVVGLQQFGEIQGDNFVVFVLPLPLGVVVVAVVAGGRDCGVGEEIADVDVGAGGFWGG